MKMQTAPAEGRNQFTAAGSDFVAVNGRMYRSSLVVSPEQIVSPWLIRDLTSLTVDALEAIIAVPDAIVLLGTGARQVFPPSALLRACAGRGIALEVMDNAAACRTYNVLAAEGRHVIAAIVLANSEDV